MKAALFDLDDTLYAELDYVYSGFGAVAQLLERRYGLDAAAVRARMSELLHVQGRGRIFDRVLQEHGLHSDARARMCVLCYRTHTPQIRLFDGARELLDGLRAAGLRLALVTDGAATMQRNKVRALDLEHAFDAVVICDELGADCWKPSEWPFRVALELLGVAAGDAAFVGNDPERDLAVPRALGMRTIQLCHERAVARAGSAHADACTPHIHAIPELLHGIDAAV